MQSNELFGITDEFLEQNSKHSKTKKSGKMGGPYTKSQKEKRQDEVYRLHFEYGYSARKIAELMKVNRNTINNDIEYWYSKMINRHDMFAPEYHVITTLERMQAQIARLREQIDKTNSVSERISLERLIYDVNSKILYTWQKLALSSTRIKRIAMNWHNESMKENGSLERGMLAEDTLTVSEKSLELIKKILDADRKLRYKIDVPEKILDMLNVPKEILDSLEPKAPEYSDDPATLNQSL